MEDATEDRITIDDGTQEANSSLSYPMQPGSAPGIMNPLYKNHAEKVKEEGPGAQEAQENDTIKKANSRPSMKLSFGRESYQTRKRAATIDIIKHKKEALSIEDKKRLARGELLIGLATILLFGIYLLRVLLFPDSDLMALLVLLPAIIATFGMRMLVKNNYSTAVLGLLFKQVNAILLMVCVFSIVVISVIESNFGNLIFAVVYAIATTIFVLSDALDNISRRFIVLLGLFFTLATVYQLVGNTFLDWSIHDNILIDFGKGYVVYKRRLKRSVYVEILCFSLEAIRTIVRNSKGRTFFLFCTGGLYRKSGESSLEIHYRDSLIQHVYEKSKRTSETLGVLASTFRDGNKARVRYIPISIDCFQFELLTC